jgi:hypothetical protein
MDDRERDAASPPVCGCGAEQGDEGGRRAVGVDAGIKERNLKRLRRIEGHDKHAGHSVEMFRSKFWLSLALTIPAPAFPGSAWIGPVFGTASSLRRLVFLQGAWRELKDRLPGMMTLISLAITWRSSSPGCHARADRGGCRSGGSWPRW